MKKLAWFLLLAVPALAQVVPPSSQSRVAGRFVAYNYGTWSTPLYVPPSGTGSKTFSPLSASVSLPDGARIMPFATNASLVVGNETVTVSNVGTGCVVGAVPGACVLTATFSNAHTNADTISSGTFGLQEALNNASAAGGGTVVTDAAWAGIGGTSSMLLSATIPSTAAIEDDRTGFGNMIIASAAPGTVRAIVGQITTSNASINNGTNSLAGVRGLVTVPSTTTVSAGYLYGTQGKAIIDGSTVAIGSDHLAGLYGQMSANGTTVNSGHVAIIIASGQNLPASSYIDGIYVESGAGPINSVLKGIINANVILDISKQSGTPYAQAPDGSGTGPCAASPTTATKAVAVKIDGNTYYIPLCGAL